MVHPGVGRTLTKVVVLRQDRSASRTDGAEVRPCLPDQVTPTALHERRGSIQVRCLKVLAVHHEVGHKVRLLRRHCRSLRERWTEAWRCTPRCYPREPCSRLVLAQRLKARNPHSGPKKACMTCTAEDIHGAWSVPTVPVNPSQSDRQSRPWRGCQRRYSSRACYMYGVQPLETP